VEFSRCSQIGNLVGFSLLKKLFRHTDPFNKTSYFGKWVSPDIFSFLPFEEQFISATARFLFLSFSVE
jgi:hypothetical protein